MIRIRDKIIDFIIGVDKNAVLNGSHINENNRKTANAESLAASLKIFLDELRSSALSDDGSRINYPILKQDLSYEQYRSRYSPLLQNINPLGLESREEMIAFWINLYNALVIDAVIAFDVRTSVTEGLIGVIAFFRRAAYNVGGSRLSCDDIEQGILRGNRGHPFIPGSQFSPNDPRIDWVIKDVDVRIHFALNCASLSCPQIRTYNAKYLDEQLELAASNFVYQNVRLDEKSKKLIISEIFRWYAEDFGGKKGVIQFVFEHLPDGAQKSWIKDNAQTLDLMYERYDWRLNSFIG